MNNYNKWKKYFNTCQSVFWGIKELSVFPNDDLEILSYSVLPLKNTNNKYYSKLQIKNKLNQREIGIELKEKYTGIFMSYMEPGNLMCFRLVWHSILFNKNDYLIIDLNKLIVSEYLMAE